MDRLSWLSTLPVRLLAITTREFLQMYRLRLAKGPAIGTEKVVIHQDTITQGGGKNRSYLQRQPGPGSNKRFIAAATTSQASKTTKTHQQLVELLLPSCKKPGATKAAVLAEKSKLFKKMCKLALAKRLPHKRASTWSMMRCQKMLSRQQPLWRKGLTVACWRCGLAEYVLSCGFSFQKPNRPWPPERGRR